MNATPTVYIVDDDPAVRHSLTRLLGSADYVVRDFASAESFLEQYDPAAPGCLLLDVRMPGMDGLQLQQRLTAQGSVLPIIIITGHADVPMAISAMKAGALDFIEKPFEDEALLACIAKGIAQDTERRSQATRQAGSQQRLNQLSPREREILTALAEGQTVEQIAGQLGISPKTVYMHRSHLMDKLRADSVVDLVKLKLAAEGIAGSPIGS